MPHNHYRVILDGVAVQGLTRRQAAECWGFRSQGDAVRATLDRMHAERINGLSWQVGGHAVQVDRYEVGQAG